MHVRKHVRMYVCMHVCMYVCLYVRVYVCKGRTFSGVNWGNQETMAQETGRENSRRTTGQVQIHFGRSLCMSVAGRNAWRQSFFVASHSAP